MQLLAKYSTSDHRQVQGWLLDAAINIILYLDEAQKQSAIKGSVCEIGIHHGRLFILLDLLTKASEKALAIDVFEDQHLNIDGSGVGNKEIFLENVNQYVKTQDNLVVYQSDSTLLDGAKIKELAGGEIRLFSIDGGHTLEITYHDLKTASEAICPGGVIILDDYFNESWPGVSEGTNKFFIQETSTNIVPFAIGGNKVFFTTLDYADSYREFLSNRPILDANNYTIYRKQTYMFGHQVFSIAAEAAPKYVLKLWLQNKLKSLVGKAK